jgi:hypothetical protein
MKPLYRKSEGLLISHRRQRVLGVNRTGLYCNFLPDGESSVNEHQANKYINPNRNVTTGYHQVKIGHAKTNACK